MKRKRSLSLLLAILICCLSVISMFSVSADISINEDDYVTRRYGCNCPGIIDDCESTYDKEHASYVNLTNSTESLPSRVDLSENKYFPPIGDQDPLNSCAAWAIIYYQATYRMAYKYDWDARNDFTKVFSPKWIYNLTNNGDDNGVDGGVVTSYTHKKLMDYGLVTYASCPPDDNYTEWCTDIDAQREATMYRITEFSNLTYVKGDTSTPITSYDDTDLDEMKRYLQNHNLLKISVDLGSSDVATLTNQYDTSLNGKKIVLKRVSPNITSNHAVCIVGYDDNITYDLNGNGTIENFERGAFKLVNSWGTSSQDDDQGFLWVMYDALNKVSNASNQNVTNRQPFIPYNEYYILEVEKKEADLTAEVTVEHTTRNNVKLKVCGTDNNSTPPISSRPTFVNYQGGKLAFDGTSTHQQEATFVFSLDYYFSCPSVQKECGIEAYDASGEGPLTLKRVKLVDKTGKVIYDNQTEYTINSTYQRITTTVGMIGDVDNNGRVNINDSSIVSRYISGLASLDAAGVKAADVDGNGVVDVNDRTAIQKYCSKLITEFDNGLLFSI